MNSKPVPFSMRLLSPRYAFSWLGLGLIKLLACMPYSWLFRLGTLLGGLVPWLLRTRQRIAKRNLDLCFPSLSEEERRLLLRKNLRDLGLMLVEFVLAWMGSKRAIARIPHHIDGLEYLHSARKKNQAIILIGAHFSHLELCARLLAQHIPLAGMYRTMDDAVLEWSILRSRLRYADAMFTKDQLRQTVRYLQKKGVLWYAPDQDMRGKASVFVPFFNVLASTITATHHLARMSGARVVPFFHQRLSNGSYRLQLHAPLEDFPSNDPVADTARINAVIERMVKEAPEQYLWIHQRFKTRPLEEPSVY